MAGCALYYSVFNEALGIPYSAECSLLGARARSYLDILEAARIGAEGLSTLLGVEVRLEGLRGWEYAGRMFNLYKYTVSLDGRYGELRVVEASGLILGVYAALKGPSLPPRAPGYYGGLLAAWGRVERPILLEPRWGEAVGQTFLKRPPVYAAEGMPGPRGEWGLAIEGLVERPLSLAPGELASLGDVELVGDLHCVTGWSVAGRRMRVVPLKGLLGRAKPRPEARWVVAVSAGGYASIAPLNHALERGFVVVGLGGRPLRREEGAPMRLYIKGLYGWKHVKWLASLVLLDAYVDGYWEALAYHERGLTAALERFKVRSPEALEEGIEPSKARPLPPLRIA